MNRLDLIGRVARIGELTNTSSGSTYLSFTVACARRKTSDPDAPTADFIEVTAFGKTAEIVSKYFTKGQWIYVAARVQNNNYVNKDGVKVYGYQFIASRIEFVGDKKARGNGESDAPSMPEGKNDYAEVPGYPDFLEDDSEEELPF